jgi:hypothetical protein
MNRRTCAIAAALYLTVGIIAAGVDIKDQRWCQAAAYPRTVLLKDMLTPYLLIFIWPFMLPVGLMDYGFNDNHLCYFGGKPT